MTHTLRIPIGQVLVNFEAFLKQNTRLVLASLILLTFPTLVAFDVPDEVSSDETDQTKIFLPMMPGGHHYGDPGTPMFGVQMYNETHEESIYFSALVASEATWVRNQIVWSYAEPDNREPADYAWDPVDSHMAAIIAANVNMIATVTHSPSWAAPKPEGPIDPQSLDDFAEFVGAAVERYDGDGIDDAPGSPVVVYWEFFNEPDRKATRDRRSGWGEAGKQYAEMLKVIYPVVKAANPQAKVVMGGLSYDWFEENGGPYVREFLSDVLYHGGGAYFDVMNFHHYPTFAKRWTRYGPGLTEKAGAIRKVLDEYGFSKPMIISESGHHSNDHGSVSSSPEVQAGYVVKLFTQAMASGIDIMIWFMLNDQNKHSPTLYGLVTAYPEVAPKPSLGAFQTIGEMLGNTNFVRTLTPSETGSPNLMAYHFFDVVDHRDIYVAWMAPGSNSTTGLLRLSSVIGSATVLDIYGAASTIVDAADGAVDRHVTVPVTGQPIYVTVSR